MSKSDQQAGAGGRTRRRLVATSVGLLAIALAAAASVAARSDRGPQGGLVVATRGDARAPGFDLGTLQGDRTISLGQFSGRPVVINFFASWCVPCRREMPEFESVSQRFRESVTFLGVDHQDSRSQALDLVAKTGVTYPTVYDPDGRVAKDYELRGLPSTVFVSADGRIVGTRLGELTGVRLEEALSRLFGVAPDAGG